MADIPAIREAIATALATLPGLRTFAYIPDTVPTPAAIVGAPEVDFDLVMARGADTIRLPVRVLVGRADDRRAQIALDTFFETDTGSIRLTDEAGVYLVTETGVPIVIEATSASVKSVIEADPTLGGAAMSCRVTRAGGYGAYTIGGVDLLGAEWLVEVIAGG